MRYTGAHAFLYILQLNMSQSAMENWPRRTVKCMKMRAPKKSHQINFNQLSEIYRVRHIFWPGNKGKFSQSVLL